MRRKKEMTTIPKCFGKTLYFTLCVGEKTIQQSFLKFIFMCKWINCNNIPIMCHILYNYVADVVLDVFLAACYNSNTSFFNASIAV